MDETCILFVLFLTPDDAKADVWAVGVAMFVLLSGEFPFGKISQRQDQKRAYVRCSCKSEPKWGVVWDDIPEAQSCVERLLNKDPRLRPTAADALGDIWLAEDQKSGFELDMHLAHFNDDPSTDYNDDEGMT